MSLISPPLLSCSLDFILCISSILAARFGANLSMVNARASVAATPTPNARPHLASNALSTAMVEVRTRRSSNVVVVVVVPDHS